MGTDHLPILINTDLPVEDYFTRTKVILHINAEELSLKMCAGSSAALFFLKKLF